MANDEDRPFSLRRSFAKAASPLAFLARKNSSLGKEKGRGGSHKHWSHLRHQLVGGGAVLDYFTELAMRRHMKEDAEAAMQDDDVQAEVSSREKLTELPYWLQGDAALYDGDAEAARAKLRHRPPVVDELQRWWETALRSVHLADASASEVGKEEYVRLSRLLQKAICHLEHILHLRLRLRLPHHAFHHRPNLTGALPGLRPCRSAGGLAQHTAA
jgi:hypothetical protein